MIYFQTPNHKLDLLAVESTIEMVKDTINGNVKSLQNNVRQRLLMIATNQLDLLGELSLPIFQMRVDMEKRYLNEYGYREGRRMFIEHYTSLHKPYDELKEVVFELIEKLDPKNKGLNINY